MGIYNKESVAGNTVVKSELNSYIVGSTALNTIVDTGVSVLLTPGTWLVSIGAIFDMEGVTATELQTLLANISLTDEFNVQQFNIGASGASSSHPTDYPFISGARIVIVDTQKTYKTRIYVGTVSGLPSISTFGLYGNISPTYIEAVKLS